MLRAVSDTPPGPDWHHGSVRAPTTPLCWLSISPRQCRPDSAASPLTAEPLGCRYAHVSQRGYYPEDLYKCNQDAIKVLPSFGGDDARFFAGMFDGHGAEVDACRTAYEFHATATHLNRYHTALCDAYRSSKVVHGTPLGLVPSQARTSVYGSLHMAYYWL